MEVILTRNDIAFLTIYFILAITLSSFIIYRVRLHLYKQLNIPSNKMRWQTTLAVFLLHIFIIVITIAILPYCESNGQTMVDICFSLSALLALFYTIWYFVNHKLYAGIDFMMILIMVAFLFMPLYLKPLSKESYYAVWICASFTTYMMFLSFCLIVLSVINFIYEVFPSTKGILMQFWDGGDSNDK